MMAWVRLAGLVSATLIVAAASIAMAMRVPDLLVPLSMTFLAAAGLGALGLWTVAAIQIDRVTETLETGLDAGVAGAMTPLGPLTIRRLISAVNAVITEIDGARTAAATDRLTQTANRTALLSQLLLEVERAKRYRRPLAVAFIDIDHFKAVNDTHGHDAGDVVLRGVADVIRTNIRASDTFGRWGGEEFLLLLPESSAEDAAEAAEKLRQRVMRMPFALDSRTSCRITVSIGVAGGVTSELTADTLIRDADAAMYSAKMLGRDQVFVFQVPNDDRRVVRAPVSSEVRGFGRELGRAAGLAAEERLAETIRSLGGRAEPGGYALPAVVEMAHQLGLPQADVDRVRVAAMFHDAGMSAVPAEVLSNPRALRQDEWQLVTQHPRVGQLMLEEASRLRDAAEIVLHHHERFAGHGYPHGLRGSSIPLGARLLAVADAYAAMREPRPHRAALTHEQALDEIRRHAGTQFDPEIASVFVRLYGRRAPGGDEPMTRVISKGPTGGQSPRQAAGPRGAAG